MVSGIMLVRVGYLPTIRGTSQSNQSMLHLTARNNLRAMKKGDLAFFYHSNCKEPGIVGTMEIVQEHSPDCESSK